MVADDSASIDLEAPPEEPDDIDLLVPKVRRPNKPMITMLLATFCEGDSARYISRLQLESGKYPPRFAGERDAIQRTVPAFENAASTSPYGKVVTTSYLFEQHALASLRALAIFGDLLSDVFMAHSLYHDAF